MRVRLKASDEAFAQARTLVVVEPCVAESAEDEPLEFRNGEAEALMKCAQLVRERGVEHGGVIGVDGDWNAEREEAPYGVVFQ